MKDKSDNSNKNDDSKVVLEEIMKGDFDLAGTKEIVLKNSPKISNSFLKALVKNFKDQGFEDAKIIEILIFLDRSIEEGKIDENFFYSLVNN
ncbi:hypothetical protein GF389_05985 [Candidatus Dojkabacteria bacterium]|nr:hypothetical protein [Candidatus Dojkabacteria bacterium]